MSIVWKEAYFAIQDMMAKAEKESGRKPGSVGLLAVSKSQSVSSMLRLYHLGQHHFAENYVQEALQKQRELRGSAITWHFIGHIQARKAKAVSENFSWVHAIDSERIALLLSQKRGKTTLAALQVCVQVNISNDSQKEGVSVGDVAALCERVSRLPHLCLRGLMTILKADESLEQVSANYQKLASLLCELNKEGYCLDTLSMGMSRDFSLAIAAGATWIRVGQALFGKRGGSVV
jgi:pyridoxal phosphate enzyme (YggS family)